MTPRNEDLNNEFLWDIPALQLEQEGSRQLQRERDGLLEFFQGIANQVEELSEVPPQIEYTGEGDALSVNIWNAVASNDAAVVELIVEFNNYSWIVSGTSKRLPGDKADVQVGKGLALARALEQVAAQFARQANGRVKHNDDNLTRRKALAKKMMKDKKKAKKSGN